MTHLSLLDLSPISEEDKPIMDWQMKRMVSLGIIKQGATSHTSPVSLLQENKPRQETLS